MSSIDKPVETGTPDCDPAALGDRQRMLADEAAAILTHAEMRGMFYRNEINREELYQLENQWATTGGRPLPTSALQYARERAAMDGFRYWFWSEQQSMPVSELLELAKQRGESLRAQAKPKSAGDDKATL